jgi:hypothetical protein
LVLEGCLTILSEERETWAAVSLRGLFVGPGFGVSRVWAAMGSEEMLTVTFQKFIALGSLDSHERRETVERVQVGADVFGTRRECDAAGSGCVEVTSRDKISIELESLILAQNERWRQA